MRQLKLSKITFFIFLTSMFILCGCDLLNLKKWQVLTSEEYGFSVEFPGEAKVFSNFTNQGGGTMIMHENFLVQLGSISYRIMVSYSNVGEFYGKTTWDAEKGFGAVRDNLLKQSEGGELVKEENISLGSYDGKEIEISSKSKGALYSQMYYKDGRIYGISITAPSNKNVDEDKSRIFNSFQFL